MKIHSKIVLFLSIICTFSIPGYVHAALGDASFIYDQTTPDTNVQKRTFDEKANTISAESSPFAGSGTSKHVYMKGSSTRREHLLGIQDSAGLLTIYKSNDDGATWTSQWTATVGDGNLKRFEIAYEQTSGDAIVVYSGNVATTNEIKYQTWDGSNWSGALNLDTVRTSAAVYGIRAAERSGSNEIGIVWADSANDVSANLWTGSAWYGEPAAALATSLSTIAASAVPTNRAYDLAFEGLSGDLMVMWGIDATADPRYVIKPAGGAWGATQTATNFLEEPTVLDISASPISDKIAAVSCTDNGGDCDFIVWSGTAWGTNVNDATSGTPVAGDSGNNVDWLVNGTTEVAFFTYNDAAGGGIDWYTSVNGATPVAQTDNTTAPAIAGADRAGFSKVSSATSSKAIVAFEDANADIFLKIATLSGTTITWSNPTGLAAAIEAGASVTGFNPIGFGFVKAAAPEMTTNAESAVTDTTATFNGTIGTTTPSSTVRGFAWGTNSALSGGDTATTTENGTWNVGAFTYNASSLTCNTTYYFRAYATNGAGTGFGAIDSFVTSACAAPPTVTTQAASSITQTTATLNGNITATSPNSTVRGFAWGTNSALSGGDTATTTENGSFGTGAYTGSLSSLTCNTTYYARAYATNPSGDGLGSIQSFVTSPCAPTVTTQSASAVTATTATLNGNITVTGGTNATVRGFAWGTNSALSGGDTATTTANGSFGTGAYTGSLSSLTCNTTYYSRAYATNSGGTGYGAISASFTTSPCAPTVTTSASVDSITQTSATLNGNITVQGGADATQHGFAWGTSSTLATAATTTGGSFTGTGAFTSASARNVSSLTCNTTYYLRAYATNSGGTGYGSIQNFLTSPCAPTVTTQSASAVTATTATLNGNITVTGGTNATVRGFAWGTNSALSGGDTATTTANGSFGTGAYTGSLSSLTCNTTYYSRAYATNSGGTGYGAISASFTTSPCVPTVVTNQESAVTQTSATLNGNITVTGGTNATVRGFAWGTNSALSGGDTATTTENGSFGTGAFTSARSGLTCNTTYYARAYATNPAGNGYGTIDSFVTSPCNPTVTTQSASSVLTTTATLNGNITNTGGSNVTTRGFAYSTNSAISTGVSTTTENGSFGTGAYTGSISSLVGNTTYYSRAYGINPGGTGYGSISAGFLTLPDVTDTPLATAITATTLTVTWTVPIGGADTYQIERCAGSGCSSFSEIATGVVGTSYDDSGLTASTVYRYRVRATNASGDGAYATSADITTSATATTELSAYRFFSAADSYTPGAALAAQNTPVTLGSAGDPFRLRTLIHFDVSNVASLERSFKLQFAEKSGTCDASFTGETYADVTGVTVIAYRDTTGVLDGEPLGAQADITHGGDTIVNQSYEEANNFSNESAVSSGQDGKWDFSLIDNGATPGSSYCIRIVQSVGSALTSYSQIPEIAIPAGSPALSQAHYRWRADNSSEVGASYETAEDTAISSGAYVGTRRRLRATISNTGAGSATGYTYRLEHSSTTCSVWLPVPTTATTQHWAMDLSPHVSDGAPTTDSAGLTNPPGKTFTAGQVRTYQNQTSAISLSNSQFTELEYSIRSTTNAVTDVLYCFRLTNAGSTVNFTYTMRPEITLRTNPGNQSGGGVGGTGEDASSGVFRFGGGGGSGSSGGTGEGQGSGGQQTGGGGGGGGGLE